MEYVLTLVVRVEKGARPAQTDALETAARAVLAILSDDRSVGEGEWAEAMAGWQDARIRKVVRRARGAEWRRAEALPGITVTGRAAGDSPAEVRVFPPVPLEEVPKDLAKLQVSGTDFEDPEELPAPEPGLPVLWINPALEMSSGKAMAQCGHAAQLAWWELSPEERKEWAAADFALAVRTASPAQWQTLQGSGLPVVQDAGFTEVAPGSRTVIAAHPLLTR
ncbi:peptidyl-tRNA hydrolase [Kribbella voronezhensis]|uniref:peptidyl-tRNA hydrolase n=1 Tax=Kribbella voronezhensis TaxID=2512212 RepID=A0A4V3FKP7_9ACTN|nr:peptidyl-tRNA hydrolase [Kribbella voronezhensis]TDU91043.1 peptidyl-tRNA hydrolase [Kribbella voronezhensis]